MTWQRATEIVPGRTYSLSRNGSKPWLVRTVTRDCDRWAFTYVETDVEDFQVRAGYCSDEHMPYEQRRRACPVNGDKPTAVFVDGEVVAVFTAGHEAEAQAYAEHLKGGA